MPHRTLRCASWEAFRAAVTGPRFAGWAFRGQRDACWPLHCPLGRRLAAFGVHRDAWAHQEERMLRIFRRKAGNHVARPPDADDPFAWFALMQHHGAPTRLLDLTWSPYVAAFFALEPATTDAAVWAVDPVAVAWRARRVTRLPPSRLDPRDAEVFRRCYLRDGGRFAWIGEPERMNARLVAQSGTFAVASALDAPLDALIGDADAVVRLVLPYSVRRAAMRELYAMNLTHATLFPDLDGLARSLAYELEFHWAFDPHTMRRFAPRPRS